ncbi:MAG: Hsp33 family molecular chaperone HslO [Bacillota bacterium]|nr:Hsp33 family molecular chaperone HslO [Bacillota bacterium]
MQQKDYLIRAMLGDKQARIFALRTTEVTREAQVRHNCSPVATAALGRTLTIGLVLGAMLKGDQSVTIQIRGDGPLKGIMVSANSNGTAKGYVGNPHVDLPLNANGKLAVGQSVGQGNLHVIKDLGLKDPYQGTVPLQTGEIAEDFAYYFTHSEQTPSAVALGVLIGTDGAPLGSGGIIIQLLPEAINDEQFIASLEQKLESMPSVSSIFAEEKSLEEILGQIFVGMKLQILHEQEVAFRCDCSAHRFSKALITLGKEELQELIDLGETIETVCHFCSQTYNFKVDQLERLLSSI